jgi:hypothetical protein
MFGNKRSNTHELGNGSKNSVETYFWFSGVVENNVDQEVLS